MVKSHLASTTDNPIGHILTLQGHPEFEPGMVEMLVDYREKNGIFDGETTAEARRRIWGKNRQGGEGLGRIGWSIWKFLLTPIPSKVE